MTQPTILLLGAGGHARACIDVIEQEARYKIAGLVGLPEQVGDTVLGYSVIGSDADIARLAGVCQYAIVTIGQIKTPAIRIRLFAELEKLGIDLPVVISPRAYVSRHASIGLGTIVMHGAIVNAGAAVGRNCILNSQSLIEHDVIVGDHCHISTRAAINSGTKVGRGTFIGSGSTVRQELSLGDHCVVGMGQSVRANCGSGTQLPAKRNP
jgi:sugar O-acyltransferase (sialic acid O-acetyltransferase NeuD family)